MADSLIFTFTLAFLISLGITPLIRRYGNGNGLVDCPDERKVHSAAIPRLGGISIYIAFFLPLSVIYLSQHIDFIKMKLLAGLIIGSSIVFASGVYDDIKGIGAWHKLLVQILASIILYYFDIRINIISNPFGEPFRLGWLSMPFTVLWIAGITNAINLIDGIDGLAAGISIMVCLTSVSLSLYRGNPLVALLGAALGGAVLGFLPYNLNPASIFMGDSGSLFLGVNIACFAILGLQKSCVSTSILVPIIALGLPIMDTLLAIARRFFKKVPIFTADKEHCHHKLLGKGYSHKQAVTILYALCVFFSLAAFCMALASNMVAALILALVIVVAFVFVRVLGYFDYIPIRKIKLSIAEKSRD